MRVLVRQRPHHVVLPPAGGVPDAHGICRSCMLQRCRVLVDSARLLVCQPSAPAPQLEKILGIATAQLISCRADKTRTAQGYFRKGGTLFAS